MVDVVDKATRSRMMSGIRGRDTKPEIVVRKFLHAAGFRFRLSPKNMFGKPDILLPKHRTAVFVHGCFWHRHPRCRYATTPATNAAFWCAKFEANVARDSVVRKHLRREGWKVIVIWECQITEKNLRNLGRKIFPPEGFESVQKRQARR
jgi:DNA mismatch endonuclease (patch repair protein)